MFDAAAQIYTHMNACTHMQTSEKRRQKRVKKRYSVIATGNNYTLSLEVTRGDKNGRVGQEEGSVVVNPAINTREDACIALCKYLFSPTLVPKAVFTSSMSPSHFFLSSLALLGLSGFALKTL